MFGYVKTNTPYVYMKDNILYKAMYCGLCKGIGKCCGQKGRLCLSYDLTFLSLFSHNVLGQDVKVNKERCVIHHIVKRPVATPDEITQKVGALNVIMAYHKLNDDVIDQGRGRLKRSFFKSSYKRAKKFQPEFDLIVDKWYKELLKLEQKGETSIDVVCDPFGQMMAEVTKVLLGDKFNQNIYDLCYHLGKWVYLIDALDDYDKDLKNNNYNVFHKSFDKQQTKEDFIKKFGHELINVFGGVLSVIGECSNKTEYKFNHDLIDNILLSGLREQTKIILENKKCKNTTKS